ncbi:N-acetylglucosamine kinase [Piscibacillus halophilus]|uniref:BadF-type ATPase n=1 Tax=Piscibacillus halophilus TaxID=571933 RepID=A0A1H9I2D1_9BACI|nr:BadF/BadG/BcrA/BcrD ATPase family protein [Piscibacillus halophilus]SEQ68780.1 BadF-type ATPase [Piscibacillus halophilus]
MSLVIGIDGGGTKTKAVMADQKGHIYAVATSGATNPNSVSHSQLKKNIQSLFNCLQDVHPDEFEQVDFCFAGMAGVGEASSKNQLHDIFTEIVQAYKFEYKLYNDGINALFAGTLGEPGIVQIAGTGTITYGLNSLGEFHRVGGWGYLFDDQASGYDLGKQALSYVFQAYDGRGSQTILEHILLNHFQVRAVPDLIPTIYAHEKPRELIASISQLVFEAYDSGDFVAGKIILEASEQYIKNINTLLKRAFQDELPSLISLAGGLFNRSDVFIPLIQKKINRSIPIQKVRLEPVAGAVIAALKEIGQLIDSEFEQNFKEGLCLFEGSTNESS